LIKFLRLLLFPFSFLYSLITGLRNNLYNLNILKSTSFEIPIISVGNLSTGGTGKTPHIEFLISNLSNQYKLATLSRGYKRKTNQFILADDSHTSEDIGDEPKQFKSKFPKIQVAVDANRVNGVKQLLSETPDLDLVLLDDAYQHRKIDRSINILLTEYSNPYFKDYILPMGNLRESRSGSNRADIIIVTKCPPVLSPLDIRRIKAEINPKPYQEIYFSYISYDTPVPLTESAKTLKNVKMEDYAITLLTAIANPESLIFYVKRFAKELNNINFPDHHYFTSSDLDKIKGKFHELLPVAKIIITTEKDAMRIDQEACKDLPIFYIPIKIKFHLNHGSELIDQINTYVKANSRRS